MSIHSFASNRVEISVASSRSDLAADLALRFDDAENQCQRRVDWKDRIFNGFVLGDDASTIFCCPLLV